MKQEEKTRSLQAEVTRVIGGERPYVATRTIKDEEGLPAGTSVTFSREVWRAKSLPERGQVVELDDVVQFKRGWRARVARPVTAGSRS